MLLLPISNFQIIEKTSLFINKLSYDDQLLKEGQIVIFTYYSGLEGKLFSFIRSREMNFHSFQDGLSRAGPRGWRRQADQTSVLFSMPWIFTIRAATLNGLLSNWVRGPSASSPCAALGA